MKFTTVVNPSSTPQTITVDVADPIITATGETPIDPAPPVNHAPVVSLGSDTSIILPTDSIILTGKATDPDTGGSIKTYMWELVAGSGNIETPNAASTKITGLTLGTSTFRLTAIDDMGASGFDEINVIVKEATTPPPPTGDTLIYFNGFDKDSDLDPFQTGQSGKGYIDKVNPISGTGSFRSRPANVSNGCRSEMQGAKMTLRGAMEWDTIYDYIVANSCHSWQFHPTSPDGASASPGLWHVNGKFVWKNFINGKNIEHTTGYTIPKGKKIHHRIEYLFGANGYFRHFVDGVKICDWTGQVGNNSTPYVKCGFNGNFDNNLAEAVKSDILYDNFSIYSVK